ncbi:unnamed protein product [Pseudo-nitzschia multistriata]|uniref:Bestrophin homolog n=1 Tax=Pseudo-nitzschia multistriata TaxID=183589 RepID=A0A448ZPZ1_9STRA|nr:unnamed protein product [Pseudo-nitzschia multistriata]
MNSMLPIINDQSNRSVQAITVGFDGVVRAAGDNSRNIDSTRSIDSTSTRSTLSDSNTTGHSYTDSNIHGKHSTNNNGNNTTTNTTNNNDNNDNNSYTSNTNNTNDTNRGDGVAALGSEVDYEYNQSVGDTYRKNNTVSFLDASAAASAYGYNNQFNSNRNLQDSGQRSDSFHTPFRRRSSLSERERLDKLHENDPLEFTNWGGRKAITRQTSIWRVGKEKAPQLGGSNQKFDSDSGSKLSIKFEEEGRMPKPSVWARTVRFFQKDSSYEGLIKNDQLREQIAEQCEEPFYRILFHFKGTVLKVIATDILFWSTIAIFIGNRWYIRFTDLQENVEIYENLASNLVYVGGFMTFFLVFYVNQNHARYFELHKESMVLMGRVNDVATISKACMPIERARRIVRYMNIAHICTYTGLSEYYSRDNLLDPLDQRFALLTDAEYQRITVDINADCGPQAVFEVLAWAMMDIREAKNHGCIDPMEAKQLRDQVLQFRSTVAKIFVTCTLPIPFFYIHFLSLLTVCYLPLFAIVVAHETGGSNASWQHEVLSLLVVALQALFTIGLRSLGQKLSDPFGSDTIDLQVARYVLMIVKGSNQILSATKVPGVSRIVERKLKEDMTFIGKAYERTEDDEGNIWL